MCRLQLQRYLCIALMCLTVNHAYAQNVQAIKIKDTIENKIAAPPMSPQQLLAKMKRLNSKTFPGKTVGFKQLPTKAQRAIQRSYDFQARRQTQACANSAPSIDSFYNATGGGTELDCAIGEIAIGCWHGDDKFTGCQLLGDGWSCQWNETDPEGC